MVKSSALPAKALGEIFGARVKRNSKYSLRAFARDLGVSAGRLSLILSGKEKPGGRMVNSLLISDGLTESEKKHFAESIRLSKGLAKDSNESVRELNEFEALDLSSIEIHAVLALLKTRSENGDPKWISAKLDLRLERVRQCLTLLQKHKIIKANGKNFEILVSSVDYYANEKNQSKLAESCRDYLQNTLPKLLDVDAANRIFGFSVIALDKKDIPRVRKIMQKAFKRATQISDAGDRSEVFNMSFLLQPMSKDV